MVPAGFPVWKADSEEGNLKTDAGFDAVAGVDAVRDEEMHSASSQDEVHLQAFYQHAVSWEW